MADVTAADGAELLTLFDLPLPSVTSVRMSDDEARWIRRNVWTEHHRKYNGGPKDWHRCRCQWGVSDNCKRGEHHFCSGQPLSGSETWLTFSGRRLVPFMQVWLADRTCRAICPCRCGHKHRTAS